VSFILTNISRLYTLEGVARKLGRYIRPEDLGVIENAAMVVGQNSTTQNSKNSKAKIIWVGEQVQLPSKYKKFKKINARGQIVLPGFVDSHTHLLFAGDRSSEFEMRLQGASYQEIAAGGGGITNSMLATRTTSEDKLFKSAIKRVQNFLDQGVTTIEIKSGYGLSFESEKKILNVIGRLKKKSPAKIFSTFLAAHALPPEYKGRQSEYVNDLALKWLPKLKGVCDFVDIFLDEGYFSVKDAEVLFKEALKLKIGIRVHADELALTGGAELAVKFQSHSADHLLKITEREIKMLAASDVTATLLPTTAFFLNVEYAPARKLLDAGARVALASDFNPGTSPTQDISIVGLLAALKMQMRIDEIIAALTYNGAYSLGLFKRGALIPGFEADFIMSHSGSAADFFYSFGQKNLDLTVFTGGKFV
jgi:imidazolonepropionase